MRSSQCVLAVSRCSSSSYNSWVTVVLCRWNVLSCSLSFAIVRPSFPSCAVYSCLVCKSQAPVDAVTEHVAASSNSSLSPRCTQPGDANDDEILIDFTTPVPHRRPPTCDVTVADDDGEMLLVGLHFAGTQPVGAAPFGQLLPQSQLTPPPLASDLPVADDGEILLVGTWPFLDGGKFGEFPPEIGIRSTTNPFLADMLASSSLRGCEVSAMNGLSDASHDYYAGDVPLLTVSPVGRRDLSSSTDPTSSPGSTDTRSSFLSFRAEDPSSDYSHSRQPNVSIPSTPSPVLCETAIDESRSSMSPITYVVSCQSATAVCRMTWRMLCRRDRACLTVAVVCRHTC